METLQPLLSERNTLFHRWLPHPVQSSRKLYVVARSHARAGVKQAKRTWFETVAATAELEKSGTHAWDSICNF